jgi:glutathione S-transferase
MDIEEKMDNHDEWYAKINPKMTVPALQYNDELLTDTHQIVSFLNALHPEKQLIPDDNNRGKV